MQTVLFERCFHNREISGNEDLGVSDCRYCLTIRRFMPCSSPSAESSNMGNIWASW